MQKRTFTANVIKGKGRGKELGFPTINLAVPENFNLKPGIYACWVKLDNDQGLAFYDIKGKARFTMPTISY